MEAGRLLAGVNERETPEHPGKKKKRGEQNRGIWSLRPFKVPTPTYGQGNGEKKEKDDKETSLVKRVRVNSEEEKRKKTSRE